ncbi:MAG: FecR domain-containing protein [Bacteroidetes bacterium]|nr:FecR domain-containing protein [Bacteroidota bacterium]
MREENTYIISGLSEADSDALFARYMSGACSAEDLALLSAWSAAHPDHKLYLEQLGEIWNHAPEVFAPQQFDEDAAWKRLQARMHIQPEAGQTGERSSETPVVKNLWERLGPVRIAASVALIIGIAATIFILNSQTEQPLQRSLAATDKPVESRLSDGSTVHLNNSTRLDYPEQFTGDVREVTLTGEAYFKIQRDEKKPFIIHAGPVDVRVLGTSFNVKAYPGREEVLVSVESGKVRCAAANDSIELIAGEEGIYNLRTKKLRKLIMDDPNAFAFRTRFLHFRNKPLSKVLDEIGDAYSVNFIIRNPELENCLFSSRHQSAPLEEVLYAIRESLNVSTTRQGNTIYIDGSGCN